MNIHLIDCFQCHHHGNDNQNVDSRNMLIGSEMKLELNERCGLHLNDKSARVGETMDVYNVYVDATGSIHGHHLSFVK